MNSIEPSDCFEGAGDIAFISLSQHATGGNMIATKTKYYFEVSNAKMKEAYVRNMTVGLPTIKSPVPSPALFLPTY
jgi:hypothetical protein